MRPWLFVVLAGCAAAGSGTDPDGPTGVDPPDAPGPSPADAPPPGAPDAMVVVPPPDAMVVPPPDAMPAAMCGNGLREGLEECDDGDGMNNDACRNDCTWARCGDGVVRAGVEECDDGNIVDGDMCSSRCMVCVGGSARFTWAGNGHCYTRNDGAVAWSAAVDACGRAHLVTYESAAEHDAVLANLVTAGNEPWIGMNDLAAEGVWGWQTGEPVVYTSWSAGEPNDAGGIEDCGHHFPLLWNDLDCSAPRAYLCEDDGWHLRADDRHAYRVVTRPVTRAAAASECGVWGGHLAVITSAAEQAFVAGLAHTTVWIGLGDTAVEGTMAWDTGDAYSYNAFAPGEPNDAGGVEDCVELRADDTWNDENCANPRGYVCEID